MNASSPRRVIKFFVFLGSTFAMTAIIPYPLRSVSTQRSCHHLMAFSSSTICRSFSTRYKVTNRNRYDRFRYCVRLAATNNKHGDVSLNSPRIATNTCDVFRSKESDSMMAVAKCTMEMLSSNRRSFNRTWDRFNPLIELILHSCKSSNKKITSIADVGCDHGMLAMSLACIAWVNQLGVNDKENQQHLGSDEFLFSNVFGTDVSSQALENGGIASLKRVNEALSKIELLNNNSSIDLPINFRIGDGLNALRVDEADAVVIAGMGVHTMIDIIYGKAETSTIILSPIDRVRTNYLFLQPTNSRPEHLIILYDCLQKKGFELCNETVAYVSGRWYINASFRRNDNKQFGTMYRFPDHYLSNDEIFDNYVKHHIQWLKQITQNGPLAEEDRRWLQHISTMQDKDEWRSLITWFIDVHTIID